MGESSRTQMTGQVPETAAGSEARRGSWMDTAGPILSYTGDLNMLQPHE